MVVPTHGQWWSNLSMQSSLTLQWCALGGWYMLHVSFHLTVTLLPFGRTSSRYLARARPSVGGLYGSLRTMPGSVVPAATRFPRHQSGHAAPTIVNAREYFDATSGTTSALNTMDGIRTSAHVPRSPPGDGPVMHRPSQKNRCGSEDVRRGRREVRWGAASCGDSSWEPGAGSGTFGDGTKGSCMKGWCAYVVALPRLEDPGLAALGRRGRWGRRRSHDASSGLSLGRPS